MGGTLYDPSMFAWCAHCQHLIGEAPPLEDFRVTHGICPGCEVAFETYEPSPSEILAKRLVGELESAGRNGEFGPAAAAIQRALAAGILPSEVMIGILHPALARIGQLWETGEVTVAEEHRFTAFCLEVIERLPPSRVESASPTLLLAPSPETAHDLGLRMLQRVAWERGVSCELLPVGTSSEEILAAAGRRGGPELLGISVGLVESIPAALGFWRELDHHLPREQKVAFGGQAFRSSSGPKVKAKVPVLRALDEFLAWIEPFSPESAPNRTGRPRGGGGGAS
jgi:methanogenic corrinoid protein MtbC1